MSPVKSTLKITGVLIIAILCFVLGVVASQMWTRATTATVHVDTTTVTAQLEQASELATAKLEYRGLVTYEEGDIDFINKTGFTMLYDASVRAGTDLSQAQVSVADKTITIVLAPSTVQQISIDPDSLTFYDEKLALFNWQDVTDAANALSLAQEDAQAKVAESTLLTQADEQAVTAVEALFAPLTGDGGYTLTVSVQES